MLLSLDLEPQGAQSEICVAREHAENHDRGIAEAPGETCRKRKARRAGDGLPPFDDL